MRTDNLTDKQLAAIGRIAVNSAQIDMWVDIVLSYVTGLTEDQLKVIQPQAMLGTKLDVLSTLGKQKLKSKKRQMEFDKIISAIKQTNSHRVTAIHGIWQRENGNTLSSILMGAAPDGKSKAIRKGSKQPIVLKADKLDAIADEMQEQPRILMRFFMEVWIKPAARKSVAKARAKSP